MGALSADALLAWKACEAMGDAVALVQGGGREGASCAWVGERFAQLLGLSEGAAVAELLQRLPRLQAGVQALAAGETSWCGACSLLDGEQYGSFRACLLAVSAKYWVVKLTPDSHEGLAVRRHLEDRESLLFTSRSVAVGEMATTLAHEINQPMGAVTNVLRGMRSRIEGTANRDAAALVKQLGDGVNLALDQVSYASRIITRIREYTQSRKPKRELVDLHEMLRHSLQLLDWDLQRHRIEVSQDWGEGAPPSVVGDGVMLQQVVVNLMRNAMDAMAEAKGGRSLQVRTQLMLSGPTPMVEVAISDTGCGVSEQQEQALFMPFVSTKPNGMGVGLNICRSFVELHQGRLWFQRNAQSGSTFCMSLPLADASSLAQVPPFSTQQAA